MGYFWGIYMNYKKEQAAVDAVRDMMNW